MSRSLIIAIAFGLAALLALIASKTGGYAFDFWGLTSQASELTEEEIEQKFLESDRKEDEIIRKEELKAGRECATKRLRRPGMYGGMRFQFIHLPKTGGSSVQLGLREWAEQNPRIALYLFNSPNVQGTSFKCPYRATEFTLFMGHRGWGFCREVENDRHGLFTATAVREPVSRMVSLYDYNLLKRGTEKAKKLFGAARDATKHTLRDLIKKYNATTDIIESGEALLRYSGSQQVRFMCGYDCLGPHVRKNDTYTEEYMLERALENLRRTDAVAVTEHLDGLVDQLKLHLRWIPARAQGWTHQNIVPSTMKSVLDDEARAILAKWGWADMKLYEAAREIALAKNHLARKCWNKVQG